MLYLRILADGSNNYLDRTKALENIFIKKLKPRDFQVSKEDFDDLLNTYNCPENKLLKIFSPNQNNYTWKPIVANFNQLKSKMPGMPDKLQYKLEILLKEYRNPKKSLPYPHLTWHKKSSWIKDYSLFPTIGITCLVRHPVTFNKDETKRKYNLKVNSNTIGIILHIGASIEDSFLRTITNKLNWTRLYNNVHIMLSYKEKELLELYFQNKTEEMVEQILTIMNKTIDNLGDTGFKLAD